MLFNKQANSIYIDREQNVWGLKLTEKSKNTYKISSALKLEVSENEKIEDNIKECYQELKGSNIPTYLTANLEGMIYLDISLDIYNLPTAEMNLLIEEEIPSFFPGNLDEYNWCWRTINVNEDQNSSTFRILLMPTETWNEFCEILQSSKIKLDMFLNPFFCCDPAFANHNISLPELEPGLVFHYDNKTKTRLLRPGTEETDTCKILKEEKITIEDIPSDIPKTIIDILLIDAIYALQNNKQPQGNLLLPSKMKPVRGRGLYVLAMLSSILLAFLALAFFARDWQNRSSLRKHLTSQIKQLNNQKTMIDQKIRKDNDFFAILDNLESKKAGNPYFVDFLSEINTIIPNDCYCSFIRFNENSIDIAITTSYGRDTSAIISSVERNRSFRVTKHNRKDNERGGTTIINITLSNSR